MAMYAEFDLDIPETLSGVLEALADADGCDVASLAGGTNLIVDIRAGRERPARIVGLGNVSELRGIAAGTERVTIGGRTTVSELLASAEIAAAAPSLVDACRMRLAGRRPCAAADVAGRRGDAGLQIRCAHRSAGRIFPGLQAGCAAAGRADHEDILAESAR
jgi:xanthine dehydrogenase iron-sulfur cluster and FAD-binding subunit A